MKLIKITAIFLILCMIILAFTACGGNTNSGSTTPTADLGNNGDSGDDDPAEQEAVKLLPDIPDLDYNGYEFTVIVSVNGEIALLNDFKAEEETGEVVNDAIYRRNAYVEEKLNVRILNLEMPAADGMDRPEAQKRIRNTISAGDNSYDAAMISGYGATALAQGGYLMDMNDMEPIDLRKPWWDQMANRDLMMKNKMFFTTGAISNVVNRATYAVLFNKNMIQDYQLDDPYELVRNGEWTYTKLFEMAVNVTQDLNGDGVIGFDDRIGALVWDDTMMSVVNSIGERCAKINSAGGIELTLMNERALSSFDAYMDFVMSDTALTYQRQDWASVRADAMFENNQALFFLQIMELVVRLRAMEVDFGVLPYPKLDTSQENYYNTVGSWHSGFMCVPIGQVDAYRTGAVLEALAAESMYTLLPAYYDIALKGKYVRDEESEEMLDLIFNTKVFDLGWIYQIGGYNEEIMNQLRNNRKDFVSMYEKSLGRAEKAIEKITAAFEEILD